MHKLYFTSISFCDDMDYNFEADVTYYVDRYLDTNKNFVEDFEIKSLHCTTTGQNYTSKDFKELKNYFYEHIMNAIINSPGHIAEEF